MSTLQQTDAGISAYRRIGPAAAYARGLRLESLAANDPAGSCFRSFEARDAARNWRRALSQHEHTSFYGVDHIQVMRAYWIGLWRGLSRAGK